MQKKLIFNQLDIEPKQYLYYRNGQPKAVLVHILRDGDCPSCYERDGNLFTDGNKVFKRLG